MTANWSTPGSRDDLTEGESHFDYTMRPGVVPHGNGLALMRAVGLKV